MPTPAITNTRTKRLSVQSRFMIGLLIAVALTMVLVILFNRGGNDAAGGADPKTDAQVVREDSHRLSQATDEKAVLVEFLDYECEACLAASPFVKDLATKYKENLTVVARYFPLPGHPNSETAAAAVEAAAQQGKFAEMHTLMYEKQTEWSHTPESKASTFREYAQSLGLDMPAYDATIADPATMERINKDKTDGVALNVQGTPTFFLEGRKIQPSSEEEFRQLIETAIWD